MTRPTNTAAALLSLAALGWIAGCGANEPTETTGTERSGDAHEEEHGHAHPSEGPHHGYLVELGNEEYHAEVVHDDEAGTVTVYVLDSTAKEAVPIEATEVTINLVHDGQPEQFTLAAQPQQGDPAGRSSRFVSEDARLAENLDREGVNARLMLTIAGKPYNGKIEHDQGRGHAH